MSGQRKRIVSFNVCGINGILSRSAQWLPERSFKSMFDYLEADIICLQETKLQTQDITKEMAIVPGFNSFFTCSASRKGYSGVAFYVRDTVRVFKAEEGLTGLLQSGAGGRLSPYREKADSLDQEIYPEGMTEAHGRYIDGQGRTITLDLGDAVIIGVYCPANSQGNMAEYRDEFFQLLDWRIFKLREVGHRVIVVGDINVAREPKDSAPLQDEFLKLHQEIDTNEWKYGSVPRKAVNDWIEVLELQDTCRDFHREREGMFTCWNQQKNCRPANFGSRIDYILVDKDIKCLDADIMPKLVGSDHCPLYADVELNVESQGTKRLPYLNRSIASTWSRGIKSFFNSSARSPRDVKPSKTSFKAPIEEPLGVASKEASSASSISDVTSQTSITSRDIEKKKLEMKEPEVTHKTLTIPVCGLSSARDNSGENAAVEVKVETQSVTRDIPKGQYSISHMFGMKGGDQWKKLNKRLDPPLCEHGERCVLKTSSKPPRKGEAFWTCARSMGGRVNKEKKFQCKTFIWDSERR